MARRYEIRGKAKNYIGFAGLTVAAWLVFGQSLFSFNLGFLNQGYQFSLFRNGYFGQQGMWWEQHDRTLGHIISLGGERVHIDLDVEIERGSLVIAAWRTPAILFGEPMVYRFRTDADTDEHLQFTLSEPGLYVISVTGLKLGGDVAIAWRVGED